MTDEEAIRLRKSGDAAAQITDQEAMRLLKSCNRRARDMGQWVLVERHQAEAIRIAWLITLDGRLAEDAVQEAFLRVFSSRESYDDTRPFSCWFFTILKHEAIKRARYHYRYYDKEVDIYEGIVDPAPGLDKVMEEILTLKVIDAALKHLSPTKRSIIVEYYWQEHSVAEIAKTHNLTPCNIRQHMYAARITLEKLLRSIREVA